MKQLGITLIQTDETIHVNGNDIQKVIIDDVGFGSEASKAGLDWDQTILDVALPNSDVLPKELVFIPALAVLTGLAFMQRRRRLRVVTE